MGAEGDEGRVRLLRTLGTMAAIIAALVVTIVIQGLRSPGDESTAATGEDTTGTAQVEYETPADGDEPNVEDLGIIDEGGLLGKLSPADRRGLATGVAGWAEDHGWTAEGASVTNRLVLGDGQEVYVVDLVGGQTVSAAWDGSTWSLQAGTPSLDGRPSVSDQNGLGKSYDGMSGEISLYETERLSETIGADATDGLIEAWDGYAASHGLADATNAFVIEASVTRTGDSVTFVIASPQAGDNAFSTEETTVAFDGETGRLTFGDAT